MTKRVIIFHIGQPKTGSSALQGFLSENAKQLEANGVNYPFAEHEDVVSTGNCSGNLMHTMQNMAKSKKGHTKGMEIRPIPLFRDYFAAVVKQGVQASDCPVTLFSAEALTTPIIDVALPEIEHFTTEYDVKVVGFVRDPYDFMISGWKHLVKTRATKNDFLQHVSKRVSERYIGVESVNRYQGIDVEIFLRNYNVHRSDIFGSFLQTINVRDNYHLFKKPRVVISNPSLSYLQAAAIVQARQTVNSPIFSALLTKRFRSEHTKERDPYIKEVDAMIMDYLYEDLVKINKLLPDKEKLRTEVRSDDEAQPALHLADSQNILMEVANEALEIVANRPKHRRRKGLPADFDPTVYLLLNPDLEAANVDPIEHYMSHGCFEGRNYQ